MNRLTHLVLLLGLGLSSTLSAGTMEPRQDLAGAGCGPEIRAREVLVLDLEPMRRHPERIDEFMQERVGDYRLLSAEPEEIRTPTRPSRDRESVNRGARKLAAKNGCDLVVLLKTGPYFGRQRSTRARIRERGYAFVVMGQRSDMHR